MLNLANSAMGSHIIIIGVGRFADRRKMRCDGRSSSEETPRRVQLVRQKAALNEPLEHIMKTESFDASLNGSTSQVTKFYFKNHLRAQSIRTKSTALNPYVSETPSSLSTR